MMMYVPGWRMHWGCTDGMLSQRKVWRLFFEGNVLFRSALKRMGLQIGKFTKLAKHRATIYNT